VFPIAAIIALHLSWAILPEPLRVPRPTVRDLNRGEKHWRKFFR
jgi:hypothetical protein